MELRVGSPKEAGIRPKTVELIRQRAEEWVAADRTQSLCLLLARRGVIFLHEAWGPLTPEPDSPSLLKTSLFPLASLTKPITATAAMILVEDGLLGPNRPVQEYIPEFTGEGKEKVMVHHLMTHTSGIDDEAIEAVFEEEPDSIVVPEPEENQHPTVNKLLNYTYGTPLSFEPGARMGYADMGIYMVGELVRRVSGQSLEQFARERIFEPLGMSDSYYIVPESEQSRVVLRADGVHGDMYNDPDFMARPSPSGGVYSTSMDMARFGQMYLNGGSYGEARILSPAAVASMTRNQIPGVEARLLELHFPEASWGLGWSVGHLYKGRVYGEELLMPRYFNHGGWGGVELWIDPDTEVVGAYLSVSLEVDEGDYTIHYADHIMNMMATGINDEQTVTDSTPISRPPAPRELSPGSPEEAGMDPDRVAAIVERGRGWVEGGLQPSLTLYAARRGVVFLNEVFGRMGSESDAAPLTREALFPIASITKPITGTAIMILVEQGLIGLNRPVQEYLPEFEGNGKHLVLVRHLLTHTSGLDDQAVIEHSGVDIEQTDETTAWVDLLRDYAGYMDLVHQTPLSRPPNTSMSYSNSGFNLLGEIIEAASGQSAPDFIQEHILQPLGMNDTYFPVPEAEKARVVTMPPDLPLYRYYRRNLEAGTPAASSGAFGTARDLAVFGQMYLNRGRYDGARILSPASISAMTRNQTPGIPAVFGDESFPESEWGLGWGVHFTKHAWAWDEPLLSPGTFCHSGGFAVVLWVDPATELVAAHCSVYTEMKESGFPLGHQDLFINSVMAAVGEQ
ncbi:MAG: serine hydrolase domain-containing protein [Anaerolineales bacterium]